MGDARVAYAAAAAAAAYLRHSYLGTCMVTSTVDTSATPPPSELLSASCLACVARLLRSNPHAGPGFGGGRLPAFQPVEGPPCRTGLMDGPLLMVAAVLAYGPGSDAYLAAVQVGMHVQGCIGLEVLCVGCPKWQLCW